MRRFVLALAFFACASEPPTRSAPAEIGGVRQRPLTEAEIESKIRDQADALRTCYGRERYNLNVDLSDFTFKVGVPNDGTPSTAEVQGTVPENQQLLSECLSQVLRRVHYPAHVGAKITLMVPIKAPK